MQHEIRAQVNGHAPESLNGYPPKKTAYAKTEPQLPAKT